MQKYIHSIKALLFATLIALGFASCAEESIEPEVLTLSQYELNFDEKQNTTTFDIETTLDWVIKYPAWITCSPRQGKGNKTISVTTGANISLARSGEIVVNANGTEKKITVNQGATAQNIHLHGSTIILKEETAAYAKQPAQVIIVGDGYSSADCEIGGLFETNARDAAEAFLGIEPFKEYRDYFRITAVVTYSQESGTTIKSDMIIDDLGINNPAQTKNTYFSTTFEGGTSTGVTCNTDRAYAVAKEKVPGMTDDILNNSTVIMLVNVNAYAGLTYMDYYGSSVAICPAGDYMDRIVNHEGGGHGWGRLADEYENYIGFVPDTNIAQVEFWKDRDPYYYSNICFSSNIDETHWAKYQNIDGYDAVKIYEGGLYYQSGVWKAEKETCMLNNVPYYSAPSREAIVQRIFKAAGLPFDFDDFIKRDHIKSLEQAQKQSSLMQRSAKYGLHNDKKLPQLSQPIMVNR